MSLVYTLNGNLSFSNPRKTNYYGEYIIIYIVRIQDRDRKDMYI